MATITLDTGISVYIADADFLTPAVNNVLTSAIRVEKQEAKMRLQAARDELAANPRMTNPMLVDWALANNPYEQRRDLLARQIDVFKAEFDKWQ